MHVQPARQPPAPPPRTLIFVVDDDPTLRDILEFLLLEVGFEARLLPDAEAVCRAFETESCRPGLLLTDYQMPGMNGLQLVAWCRRRQPDLKTISLSGTAHRPELARPECRPDRVFTKPFAPAELLAAIRALLAQHSASGFKAGAA